MKLDFKRFKKVGADQHTTTLQHPDGHQIKIAHTALSPKMRGELAQLPFADGGPVPNVDPEKAKQFVKGFNEGSPSLGQMWQNLKEGLGVESAPKPSPSPSPAPKKMAHGGLSEKQPEEQNSSMVPDKGDDADKIVADAQSAASTDQSLQGKRDLYNQLIAQSQQPQIDPDTHAIDPNTSGEAVKMATFGANGEAPAQFNSDVWKQAESQYSNQQAAQAQQAQVDSAKLADENKTRVAAGLPPIEQPASPQINPSGGAQSTQPAATLSGNGAGNTGQSQPDISDPYGVQATYDNLARGINEQKAGLSGQAAAEAALGRKENRVLQTAQEQQAANAKSYQDHYNELDAERQAVQHDIQNQHIDPNHYLNSMGTGQKISSAIGLILGGLGAGAQHSTTNLAAKFIDDQINRDIDAQKAELGKKENLLSANLRQFGNIRDATDMTRIMQNDIVGNKLKQAAAQTADPLARSRALQQIGQIDQQNAAALGQIAMRKTLLSGMQNGAVDPAKVVEFLVPEHSKEAARKELVDAQNTTAFRNMAVNAFDKLSQINTVGNRVLSPIESKRQAAALKDPLVAALSKNTAGRFTEQDAGMLDSLFPKPGDDANVIATKRSQLIQLANEKMHFPTLNAYGINLGAGQSRPSEGAPVLRKK